MRLAFADGRDPAELGDDTAAVLDAVAAAEPLIFATPVYRGSMTAALKNLFDQLPLPALARATDAVPPLGPAPLAARMIRG